MTAPGSTTRSTTTSPPAPARATAASPGPHRVRPFERGPTNPGPGHAPPDAGAVAAPDAGALADLPADLAPIRDKVLRHERLTREDGRALFATGDLNALGALANFVNESLNGARRRWCS